MFPFYPSRKMKEIPPIPKVIEFQRYRAFKISKISIPNEIPTRRIEIARIFPNFFNLNTFRTKFPTLRRIFDSRAFQLLRIYLINEEEGRGLIST